MAFDSSKLKSSLTKAPKNEKMLYGLALATLIATFLPWMDIPFLGGSLGGISGFRSVGFLTFIGSLGYLLWKLVPMAGVKIPKLGVKDEILLKILSGLMVAGPVLWLIQSGFAFGMIGFGLWIALITSGAFAYFTFKK